LKEAAEEEREETKEKGRERVGLGT